MEKSSVFPDLKPGKHLVFDNFSIADTFRLHRQVHQPRRDPSEPIIQPQRPWEGIATVITNVMHDEASGQWRMWYTGYDVAAEETRKKLNVSRYGNIGEPQPFVLCYATSDDGIRWNRAPLGIYGDNN